MADWNEEDHPRDDSGKFTSTGGSVQGSLAVKLKNYGMSSDMITRINATTDANVRGMIAARLERFDQKSKKKPGSTITSMQKIKAKDEVKAIETLVERTPIITGQRSMMQPSPAMMAAHQREVAEAIKDEQARGGPVEHRLIGGKLIQVRGAGTVKGIPSAGPRKR